MRITVLILVLCLVLSAATYSAACDVATDEGVYSCLYPCTASTSWIPGNDLLVPEEAVPAAEVLKQK